MNIKGILDDLNVNAELCEYWDIRVEETSKSEITYEDFELIGCSVKPSLGAFIRVYQGGLWYYSSTTELNRLSDKIV